MLRRERLAGLSPGAYLASKLVVLAALVLVQSALLVGVLAARLGLPAHGILVPALVEIYVTVVLARRRRASRSGSRCRRSRRRPTRR